MIGYRQPLGKAMMGHKMPLGKMRIGSKMPLLGKLYLYTIYKR
jgi:hypothetical protein